MRLNKLLFLVPILLLITNCSGGGSSGGGSGTSTVTLSSIAVTPANPGMLPGTTKQLTATGTNSIGTTQDLTTSVTWISSDTKVATISTTAGSNGLVTSLAAGTTTITASSGSVSGSTLLTVQDDNNDNVITVTVNGGVAPGGYPNEPCVSVTICSPGTSTCQTIDNVLLDTGSYGLRIFKSLLTVSLTPVASGSGSLTECIQYGDNSADWGPVQLADIILGNEPAVRVPIQIIDSTSSGYNLCGLNGQYTLDTIPSEVGFNGILGVGLLTEDCGSKCTSSKNNGWYYSCSGSNCSTTTVPLNNQVQNPVSLLPLDNNGLIVQFLTPVPLGGLPSVNGKLILGIGTRSNNIPSGVTVYPADPTYGEFITIFNGNTYSQSFIDSGSNGLFFDTSSIKTCTVNSEVWFCASPTQTLPATNEAYDVSSSGDVSFQIGDASIFISPSNTNKVFIELGAPYTSGNTSFISFDWGLPFFLRQKSVYVGIEGTTSILGTGPYWAY
jgi:hypothetical protein